MSSLPEISAIARNMLRDFPKFFEIELGPLNVLTLRLPHPLISSASLQVFVGTPTAPNADTYTSTVTKAWKCDERNGLLKLDDEALLGSRILVAGYYYTWFTDSDLAMHASQMAGEHLWNRPDEVDDFTDVEAEVVAMGSVVRALNSLALELSLDIDVSTPEGIYIPARQRFTQVIQMMQYWEGQYTDKAASLNVGLGALEQFNLRRISPTTNRYVPLYKPREIDDHRFPQRIRPRIPTGTTALDTPIDDDVIEVTEDMNPASREIDWVGGVGYSGSGWQPGPDAGSPYPPGGN